MNAELFNLVQSKINNGFDYLTDKIEIGAIQTPELSYEEFESELRSLINFTKNNQMIDDKHYSLFIFGPTGSGKSVITEQISKDEGCIYHKLEIQKVPIEILQGFPYLTDIVNKDGEMKIAKLAPSTILPPSNDERTWVLHLDEFNKADSEKMAAVMNLVYTGELGGSADYNEKEGKSVKYRLPKKTIIVGCGNTRSQKNIENLNVISNMDTATSERWHRTAYLPYNAESWIKSYAIKPHEIFEYKIETRIPSIILNYIIDKMLENGSKEDPFLIPIITGSEEGMEGERTTSPRAWTFVADIMYIQMYNEYNNNFKKEYEDKYQENGFNIFCQKPENQIKYLKQQVFEFGIKGNEIIADIISRYIYFGENRVIPSNVLFDYIMHRDKVKKLKERKGAILYLFLGIAYAINDLKEMEDVRRYCVNVSTFMEDCEIPSEDAVAFIQTLKRTENKSAKEFNDFMISISEKYKNAFAGYYHTSINEI